MKIAIPYENGQVFQHFGHSAQFKIYDAENGLILSSEVEHDFFLSGNVPVSRIR